VCEFFVVLTVVGWLFFANVPFVLRFVVWILCVCVAGFCWLLVCCWLRFLWRWL